MRKIISCVILMVFILVSYSSRAELLESSGHYFSIAFEEKLPVSAEQLNKQILKIEKWWHPGHTYSGKSENLFIDLKKRSCFCERLGNQGIVRHLDLVNYQPNKLFRFRSGLGPLQSLPINGVLDFAITSTGENQSSLKVTYQVAGNTPELKNGLKRLSKF